MPVKTIKTVRGDTPALRLKNARSLFRTGLPHALGVRPVSVTPAKVTATLRVIKYKVPVSISFRLLPND